MTDNIDFKELWGRQQVKTSEIKELIKNANQFKIKSRLVLIATNIIMVVTSCAIGLAWYYFQSEFITTKMGIIICILAMMIYVAFRNKSTPLLVNSSLELDAKTQLQQLIALKEKQHFQQTRLLNGYFVFLSLGLGLYMYEYTTRMSLFWALFSYGIVLFWIALNAFYFRPKMVMKQQARLNKLIDGLKELNEQLTD